MSRRFWTDAEVAELDQLRKAGTPAKLIAEQLGRTKGCIYNAARRFKLELVPDDVAEANRRAMNAPGVRKPRNSGGPMHPDHARKIGESLRASAAHKAAGIVRAEKLRAHYADPANREKVRRAGRARWHGKPRAVPPPFESEYRALQRHGASRSEAVAALQPRIDAWLRTFEGQLWRVRTGQARIVPNIKVSRVVSADHSLTGSSLAAF